MVQQFILVVMTLLFISSVEARDHLVGVAPLSSIIENQKENKQIKEDCRGDVLPIVKIESLKETSDDVIETFLKEDSPPIFLFRRDSHFHVGLKLKNDFFSAPLNLIRQGEMMVFDQGETHGTDLFIGVKDSKDTRFTYLYETNLYTQKSTVPEPVDDPTSLF